MVTLLRPRRGAPLLRLLFLLLLTVLVLSTLALSSLEQQQSQSNAAAAAALFNNPLVQRAPSSSLLSDMLDPATHQEPICKPTGQISDARCDYETVESVLNSPTFFGTLDALRRQGYFRYYKVDLYKDCPFWNENGLCMSRDCTVSKMDEENIPKEFRAAHLSSVETAEDCDVNNGHNPHANHYHHLHEGSGATCTCAETDFCHWEDEDWSPESQWVDLLANPERFTGYAGPSANRVWRAIYEENCFEVGRRSASSVPRTKASLGPSWLEPPRERGMGSGASGYVTKDDLFGKKEASSPSAANAALTQLLDSLQSPMDPSSSEQCLEKRVFYRLISGLHASISIHICHDHLDQSTGQWSPNLECFISRIAHHPERLENVYFNYVVLVRALAKLAERLKEDEKDLYDGLPFQFHEPARGLPKESTPEDHSTPLLASLLTQAFRSPPTFDEQSMFDPTDQESGDLRQEFRARFRNVSRIMDCVGCDKCRLWGKLQVNGLGTALKILFGGGDDRTANDGKILQRSELVALINTVHRFGESLRAVETFREKYQEEVRKRTEEETEGEGKEKNDEKKVIKPPKASRSSAPSPSASPSAGRGTNQKYNASHETSNKSKDYNCTKKNTRKEKGQTGSIQPRGQERKDSEPGLVEKIWIGVGGVVQGYAKRCEEQWERCLGWVIGIVGLDRSTSSSSSHPGPHGDDL